MEKEKEVLTIRTLSDGTKVAEKIPKEDVGKSPQQIQRDKWIGAIVEGTVSAVKEHVDSVTAPLIQQIRELQARPTLKYSGVYEAERQYSPGEFVTWDGSLWHCNAFTKQRPGSCADWTLAAKRGVDGRKTT